MKLDQFAAEAVPEIDAEMRQVVGPVSSSGLTRYTGMLHYHLGWVDEHFQPISGRQGKRIRPLVCVLACWANGADWRQALPAAAAVELLHNFSLIHDDIQDGSPLRHGRPTLWTLWGPAQAINAGDALFAMAHLAMHGLLGREVTAEQTLAGLEVLNRSCIAITEGQFLDLDFETRPAISVTEYVSMIGRKTATLLAVAAKLGALAAGATVTTMQQYYDFAFHLGLAFQIRDDILGIWGNSDVTGKSVATDLVHRKKSLPVLYGLEANSQFQALYCDNQEMTPEVVQQAANLLEQAGARTYAEEQTKAYSRSAVQHLEAASPQGEAGQMLWELTETLVGRVQ